LKGRVSELRLVFELAARVSRRNRAVGMVEEGEKAETFREVIVIVMMMAVVTCSEQLG
jgi:hypothetical protein